MITFSRGSSKCNKALYSQIQATTYTPTSFREYLLKKLYNRPEHFTLKLTKYVSICSKDQL